MKRPMKTSHDAHPVLPPGGDRRCFLRAAVRTLFLGAMAGLGWFEICKARRLKQRGLAGRPETVCGTCGLAKTCSGEWPAQAPPSNRRGTAGA